MASLRRLVLLSVLILCVPAAAPAEAERNAARLDRGAQLRIAGSSLNDRWSKPADMIRAQRSAGPIINELADAVITVDLPVTMQVTEVAVVQGDHQGTFSRVRELRIEAADHEAKTVTLENKPGELQQFAYAADTDRITLHVESLYPPDEGDARYGAVSNVQVLVSDDLAELFSPPGFFHRAEPFVMLTPNLVDDAPSPVVGQPRKATGHPLTIWDSEDIARLREQIATEPAAREAYDRLIAFCDSAVANPIAIPEEKDDGTDPAVADGHRHAAQSIGNLGMGYALSGEEAYAREARRMLMELADRFEGWPVGGHPQFTHDSSKWSWQRLNDALWLIPSAWGFDLIHNSESLSDADRAHIRDGFIMPCVRNIMRSEGIIAAKTNWSAIAAAAVMIGSRVSGDDAFYEKAKHGIGRQEKRGGAFWFVDEAITNDGLWAEGAIGYQFMAMRGLLVMAEVLWRDGVDLYSHSDGRLKRVFDSPIWYAYPGGRGAPAIGDTGGVSLYGRDAHLYQYPRLRYDDPTYDPILAVAAKPLETIYNLFMPAIEFGEVEADDMPAIPSILFADVGFGIVRAGEADDAKYVLLNHGEPTGHGHPDQLSFHLFGLGQELFADGGSAWYSTDIYRQYYSHTLANNTIAANGMSQIMTGANLETFGSLGGLAVMRAHTDGAIPGITLDRTLVLADDRLYDVYLASGRVNYTLDLPYHSRGELEQSVASEAWAGHDASAPGYAYFEEPVAAAVDDDWQATWRVDGGHATMHYLGEEGTQVIFASTPKGGSDLPTAMVRRRTNHSVFAGVIDLVPNETEPSVATIQRIDMPDETAFGLRAELRAGGYEQVMVRYGEAEQSFGDWRTDARVAMVRVEDDAITAFYLAGGTHLVGPAGEIRSSAPTLLAYREVADGLAQVQNQAAGEIDVQLAGLTTFDRAYATDAEGRRGDAELLEGDRVRLRLAGRGQAELARGEQPSVAEHEQAIRQRQIAELIERERQQRERMAAEAAETRELARAGDVPEDYVVIVQAGDFVEQEGGEVAVVDDRAGGFGSAISQWNPRGHRLHYSFEVEHAGYYQVVMKYCREGDATQRSIRIDGEYPHPAFERIEIAGTGGWSRGSDNWQLARVNYPQLDEPALVYLEAGEHTLTLENLVGDQGANVDYVAISAPFLEPARDRFEE